jgi:hypothetical protein
MAPAIADRSIDRPGGRALHVCAVPADTTFTNCSTDVQELMHPILTRYEIELDMLERDRALSDRQAVELLRSEFQLALNASQFSAVCAGDIGFAVASRIVPQEGVARYAVVLEFEERTPGLDDEQASALLRREFQRALNASYFWRVASEDFRVEVVSRRTDQSRRSLNRRAA